jgi:hypothetical protein
LVLAGILAVVLAGSPRAPLSAAFERRLVDRRLGDIDRPHGALKPSPRAEGAERLSAGDPLKAIPSCALNTTRISPPPIPWP